MTTTVVGSSDAVELLAAGLLDVQRSRPWCVISVPVGARGPLFDLADIERDIGDVCPIYVIATGTLTYDFDARMPLRCQVFGGAGRVYPVGMGWVTRPELSPLRFVHDAGQAQRMTAKLIADALAMAQDAGAFTRAVLPQVSEHRTGRVGCFLAEDTRAMVVFDGGGIGMIQQERTCPGVPLTWLLHVDQPVEGQFDLEHGRLLLETPQLTSRELLALYPNEAVTLALVTSVERQSAQLVVHPSLPITVTRAAVSSNPIDRVDILLAAGDVVPVRVVRDARGHAALRLCDVNDDDEIVPAPVLVAGGEPWLREDRDLVEALDGGDVLGGGEVRGDGEPAGETGAGGALEVGVPDGALLEVGVLEAEVPDIGVLDAPTPVRPVPGPFVAMPAQVSPLFSRSMARPGPGLHASAIPRRGDPTVCVGPPVSAPAAAVAMPAPGAETARHAVAMPAPVLAPSVSVAAMPAGGGPGASRGALQTCQLALAHERSRNVVLEKQLAVSQASEPAGVAGVVGAPAAMGAPAITEAAGARAVSGATGVEGLAGTALALALRDELAGARLELGQLAHDNRQLQLLLAKLRGEQREQRSLLRNARREQNAGRGQTGPRDQFLAADDWVRHEIFEAWINRMPPAERLGRPLPVFIVGVRFATSVQEFDLATRAKAFRACVDVLTGLARDMGSRKVHPLRIDDGGSSGDRVRADGSRCMRAAVEVNTPSARRLHYWVMPSGTIELARVVLHDDTTE